MLMFALRLAYGLNLDFWGDDEKQIYLLGLRWFTTEEWPFFGPDVVYTQSQLPGALQSLLVGSGFYLWAIPEMPHIMLNLLSILAVFLFATFLTKGQSNLSQLWTLVWLGTLTWSLEMGTHVYNPSYLLLPAVGFWIAYFDMQTFSRRGWLKPIWAFFIMGLAFGFIGQLHLSWPLLLPFACQCLWQQRQRFAVNILALLVGAAILSTFVVPTFLQFGLLESVYAGTSNSTFNWGNLAYFFHYPIRLIAYSTYEPWMFLGLDSEARWSILKENWWLIPLVIVLLLVSLVYALWFLYEVAKALRRGTGVERQAAWLFVALWIFCVGIYFFSSRAPVARNFYLYFPAMVFIGWTFLNRLVDRLKVALVWFKVVVVCAVAFTGLLACARYPEESLYKDRELLWRTLKTKNADIFSTPRYPKKQQLQ